MAETVESLRWEGDDKIKIVVFQGCHQFGKPDRKRTFLFYLKNKKFELLSEELF